MAKKNKEANQVWLTARRATISGIALGVVLAIIGGVRVVESKEDKKEVDKKVALIKQECLNLTKGCKDSITKLATEKNNHNTRLVTIEVTMKFLQAGQKKMSKKMDNMLKLLQRHFEKSQKIRRNNKRRRKR